MSHLSFSMNVPVSHIEVNDKLFFRYSSFKIVSNFVQNLSYDLWTDRTEMTEQIFDIRYRSREIPLGS